MPDMILPQSKDAIHKAWLYRVLTGIYDNPQLADRLYFKGGTCAAMLGYLDRFSINLDFDYPGSAKTFPETRRRLEQIFKDLGLTIKDKIQRVPQYFLKYESEELKRNTLKIDVNTDPPKANRYEAKRFSEIDRIITCQTRDTMVANKLVALINRYKKKEGGIAGRDLYDVHYFFLHGFPYNKEVIKERGHKNLVQFFTDLIAFIEKRVTEEIINQDLNMLLTYEKFSQIRKILKQETLMLLRDELERLKKSKK